MKQIKFVAVVWIVLLAIPPNATAGLFSSDNNAVATEVTVLDEDTQSGALDFSPDGRYLAVDSHGNGGTNIWDLEKKRIVTHLPEGGAYTWQKELLRYNPNGKQLAICHGMGTSQISVDVYDPSSGATIYSISDEDKTKGFGGGCAGIAFTPDGKELVRLANRMIFHPGNNVIFYDTSSWLVTRGIRTIPLIKKPSNAAWNDKSNWSFLDAPDMLWINPDKSAAFHPDMLSFSKDGRYLALAGGSFDVYQAQDHRNEVALVDMQNLSLMRVIPGHVESFDWNPDNIHIAVPGDLNGKLNIFDSQTGRVVLSEEVGSVHVLVRYTPDGKYLIEKVGKKVEIWDGQHQNLLQVIKAEPSYIAVSQDGHYFAMGGAKSSIWDANALLSLTVHPKGASGKVIIYKLK